MKKNIYIVYDKITLEIVKKFDGCMTAYSFAETNTKYVCINKTHPKNKLLLSCLIGDVG